MSASPGRLEALTGLRFVAAFHVLAAHYALPHLTFAPQWFRNVVAAGPTSVTMFYVLSGFILAYTYLGPRAPEHVDRKAFWMARFARIYPIYVLGLLIALPPFIAKTLALTPDAAAALQRMLGIGVAAVTLTQAWFPTAACQWNCPGWSLSVEAFFYLLFPFMAVLIARWSERRLVAVGVGMCLVLFVFAGGWLLIGARYFSTASDEAKGAWLLVGAYNPFLRVPQFALGVVLGKIFTGQGGFRGARGTARWADVAAVAAIVALLSPPWVFPELAFLDALATPLFGVLVFLLATETGIVQRVLAHPWLVILGEASFALYLLHSPIHQYLVYADRTLGLEARGTVAFFLGYTTLSLLVSIAAFRYVEQPARQRIRRWYQGGSTGQ